MKNTLKIGDKVVVDIMSTYVSDIERGDIIVFNPPKDLTDKKYFIKRVIGLSGETIEIRQGIVYVNGKELKEDYISSNNNNDYGPYIVPENCYFVLGDNRANSFDSRYWKTPYISREDIVGKAVIKLTGGIYKFDSPVYDIQ
jgi:signal peptidase I